MLSLERARVSRIALGSGAVGFWGLGGGLGFWGLGAALALPFPFPFGFLFGIMIIVVNSFDNRLDVRQSSALLVT